MHTSLQIRFKAGILWKNLLITVNSDQLGKRYVKCSRQLMWSYLSSNILVLSHAERRLSTTHLLLGITIPPRTPPRVPCGRSSNSHVVIVTNGVHHIACSWRCGLCSMTSCVPPMLGLEYRPIWPLWACTCRRASCPGGFCDDRSVKSLAGRKGE